MGSAARSVCRHRRVALLGCSVDYIIPIMATEESFSARAAIIADLGLNVHLIGIRHVEQACPELSKGRRVGRVLGKAMSGGLSNLAIVV